MAAMRSTMKILHQLFVIIYRLSHRNNLAVNSRFMLVFITILIVNACIAGTIPATPENITVTFLTPTTVRVAWQTMIDPKSHPIEKYIVTYKPMDDRVVQDVAGNSDDIILDRLSPSTQYTIAVTAIWLGKKYRSRPIIFRTLDSPKTSSQQDFPLGAGGFGYGPGMSGGGGAGSAGRAGVYSGGGNGVGVAGSGGAGSGNGANGVDGGVNGGFNLGMGIPGNLSGRGAINGSGLFDDVTSTHGTRRELPTIRGVEIGIVLIVLCVWAGAIALFFNRWGKIRMLLPYQPDYKHEQLKVPGTGVCTGGVCNGQHSHQNLHPDLLVKCLPRCEGCGIFDRCFQYPRRELERDCGCQFALLHKADTES